MAQPAAFGANAVPREYVNVSPAPRKRHKKSSRRSGGKHPTRPEPWKFDRKGNARDGRGDFRSAKRLRRKILTARFAIGAGGRKWNRARKALRLVQPGWLLAHPADLLGQAEVYRLTHRERAA